MQVYHDLLKHVLQHGERCRWICINDQRGGPIHKHEVARTVGERRQHGVGDLFRGKRLVLKSQKRGKTRSAEGLDLERRVAAYRAI